MGVIKIRYGKCICPFPSLLALLPLLKLPLEFLQEFLPLQLSVADAIVLKLRINIPRVRTLPSDDSSSTLFLNLTQFFNAVIDIGGLYFLELLGNRSLLLWLDVVVVVIGIFRTILMLLLLFQPMLIQHILPIVFLHSAQNLPQQ